MSDKLARLFATFFYIGDIPIAPGSAASFAGMLIWIILYKVPVIFILLMIAITVLGFVVSTPAEKASKEKDPSFIVIDEVSGVMISFLFLPLSVPVLVTTFFLFRAFDMFKLYPVNKFEEIEGGAGIMMDDIIAGIYTNLTMQVAIRWAGIV